jgi:myo-inositol-1(or 4)-monophosphatase
MPSTFLGRRAVLKGRLVKRCASVAANSRALLAGRLALLGGRIALERARQHQIQWKPDGSMVTDADVAIQQYLAAKIRQEFPRDGIIGEERPEPATWPPDTPDWWVLDPLDGTANFGLGIPGFSISVGILRNGEPLAGAVYDPTADWLYIAGAGLGAWLNGRRLQLHPQPLSDRSFVAIRTPYDGEVPPFVAGWLRRYRLRRYGSTALQLCYAACGGFAVIHDQRAFLWDVAGAAPVLLEAGGRLTTPEGRRLFPFPISSYAGEPIAFLAGDPLCHPVALADVRAGSNEHRA